MTIIWSPANLEAGIIFSFSPRKAEMLKLNSSEIKSDKERSYKNKSLTLKNKLR